MDLERIGTSGTCRRRHPKYVHSARETIELRIKILRRTIHCRYR